MESPRRTELTPQLKEKLDKAKKMEWITILYLVSVVVLMYFVLGSSQAMRTAWLEDVLSIVPAISFLVAMKFYNRPATRNFPYGFHRVFDIAFLAGSLALFSMGLYLCFTSVKALIMAEHPTIGSWYLFGHQVWLGWLMIAVLLYSSLPAMYIGRKKLPLAKALHNKILYTDADAQKADYVTAFAAIVGIIGVGLGFWWADAAAATLISFSVLKDGSKNLKNSVTGLMDRRATEVEGSDYDELMDKLVEKARSWSWVSDAGVRLREYGQVYFGELLLVLENDSESPAFSEIHREILDLDWKLQDIMIMPVDEIPEHYHS